MEFPEFVESKISKKSQNNPEKYFFGKFQKTFFSLERIFYISVINLKQHKKTKMEKKKKSGAINNGAGWDNSSRNMLKELISKGLPVKKIAKVMGRTPNAITYQKSMMGLTTPNPVRVSKGKPKNFINLLDLIKKAKESNMTKVPKMPAAIKSKIVAKRVTAPVAAPVAPVSNPSNVTREQAKDITRSAREIARANGKRITMAMFFVEDL